MYSVTPQHCLPDVAECGAGLVLPLHSTDSKLEGIDSVWDHVVENHMCMRTSCSRHFMTTGMSATGLQSFRVDMSGLLGTGMMVENLEIRETTAPASIEAQPLS